MSIDYPAFILGNGPRLPPLTGLERRFTVGVNRILKTGFVPTVILWVDRSVYRENAEAIDTSDALQVCDRSMVNRHQHIGLHLWAGDDARKHVSEPTILCCDGNTGCCAARWALALGCPIVYLLGMEAEYEGERTNFYGVNPWHHRTPDTEPTLAVMRRELERLLKDGGSRVRPVGGTVELADILATTADVDQQSLRLRLRQAVAAE